MGTHLIPCFSWTFCVRSLIELVQLDITGQILIQVYNHGQCVRNPPLQLLFSTFRHRVTIKISSESVRYLKICWRWCPSDGLFNMPHHKSLRGTLALHHEQEEEHRSEEEKSFLSTRWRIYFAKPLFLCIYKMKWNKWFGWSWWKPWRCLIFNTVLGEVYGTVTGKAIMEEREMFAECRIQNLDFKI